MMKIKTEPNCLKKKEISDEQLFINSRMSDDLER